MVIWGTTVLTEDYPSPAEGIGLENRESEKSERGFESLIFRQLVKKMTRGGAAW